MRRGYGLEISNDCLPALLHLYPLDTNDLRSAAAKPAQDLDLRRESVQQPSSRCCHHGDVPIAAIGATGPAQHRHADGVRAGHLYGQCRLDLVLRLGPLDEGQHRI